MLFGGPHTSEPSFRRACVRPSDTIYPIAGRDGILYVLGCTRVQRILTLEDYIAARADLFDAYLTDPPAWVLERGHPGLSPRSSRLTRRLGATGRRILR